MFGFGATSAARGILLALLVALLSLALVTPASAQEPAGPDQYLPNVPGVPDPGDDDTGDDSGDGNDPCPDAANLKRCPDDNDGDNEGGSDSDDAGGAGAAAPPGGGDAGTGEISAGSSLPFTGYPLSSLALTVLVLLVVGAALRLTLVARKRIQRTAPQV